MLKCLLTIPGDEGSAAAGAPGGAEEQRLAAEVHEAGHHEHGVQVEAVLQLLVGAAAAAPLRLPHTNPALIDNLILSQLPQFTIVIAFEYFFFIF